MTRVEGRQPALNDQISEALLSDQINEVLSAGAPNGSITDHIGLQYVGRVAIITLARPEQHNVLSLAAWQRIAVVAAGLSMNDDVHCVLLRGSGDRAFGAGADILEFPDTRMSPALAVEYNEAIARGLQMVASIPVPVVAMIHGLAVGGGLELSAACDIRFASEDARMGIPIGRLGVTLGFTEAAALVRLIGSSELKFLLMSGELITAADALRIGLVQRVVPRAELIKATVALLVNVLSSSMPTLRSGKLVADMATRQIVAADTEALARYTVEVYGGPDLAEGVAAFSERRAPNFPSQQVNQDAMPIGQSTDVQE